MTGEAWPAELHAPLRVSSAVPGRIRLRLAQPAAHRHLLADVAQALEARPEVFEVLVRPASASLVVRHDTQPAAVAALHEALASLGVVSAPRASGSDHARRVQTTALAANAMAARTTGSDLRLLAPLTLGLLALRRAARNGPRLADAPWYVLAWYAWESYTKLNPPVVDDAGRPQGDPT